MKNVLHILVSLVFLINYSCKAQQLVQTTADVPKLKTNEQQFINKPLKDLLKEIKPEIKMAFGNIGDPCFFTFRFIDIEETKRLRSENALFLYVYVKEPLDWYFEKREKGKEYQWTKEDVEKYGNLTVIRIKIGGKY